jgi:hypothetical protein
VNDEQMQMRQDLNYKRQFIEDLNKRLLEA